MNTSTCAKEFSDVVAKDYVSDGRSRPLDRVLSSHMAEFVSAALKACGFSGSGSAPFSSLYVIADGGKTRHALKTQDVLTAGALGRALRLFGRDYEDSSRTPSRAASAALAAYETYSENGLLENNWEYLDPEVTALFLRTTLASLIDRIDR